MALQNTKAGTQEARCHLPEHEGRHVLSLLHGWHLAEEGSSGRRINQGDRNKIFMFGVCVSF